MKVTKLIVTEWQVYASHLPSLCGACVKMLAFARKNAAYSLHTSLYLTNYPSKATANCFFGDAGHGIGWWYWTACTHKVGMAVTQIDGDICVYGHFQSLLLLYYLW